MTKTAYRDSALHINYSTIMIMCLPTEILHGRPGQASWRSGVLGCVLLHGTHAGHHHCCRLYHGPSYSVLTRWVVQTDGDTQTRPTQSEGEHSLSGYIGFMDLICVSALMLQFPDGPVSYVCGIWWRNRPRWHINLCRGCKHTLWCILWAKVPRMQTVGMDGQNTETEQIASNSFASFLLIFGPLLSEGDRSFDSENMGFPAVAEDFHYSTAWQREGNLLCVLPLIKEGRRPSSTKYFHCLQAILHAD